jgi:serine/threonine-protein kinase RsbW
VACLKRTRRLVQPHHEPAPEHHEPASEHAEPAPEHEESGLLVQPAGRAHPGRVRFGSLPLAGPRHPSFPGGMMSTHMSQPAWSWTVDRAIPSERGAGRRIIDEVLGQLESRRWSEHEVFSIRLALEEAIVNAIKHGNGLDDRKQVNVACKLSADRLWIKITDEGTGFNPEQVPDPTDPENLEKPCGRGIMLMRSYMTRVEYNARGNVVEMEKERSGKRGSG